MSRTKAGGKEKAFGESISSSSESDRSPVKNSNQKVKIGPPANNMKSTIDPSDSWDGAPGGRRGSGSTAA